VRTLENRTFLLLIIAVSLAFAWILWPFYGAVLWAVVLATLFAPLHRRLSKSMRRRNLAALATVLIIVAMVIVPLTLMAASLLQEASGV
jgi:predicted PurR-regulated permease PerM